MTQKDQHSLHPRLDALERWIYDERREARILIWSFGAASLASLIFWAVGNFVLIETGHPGAAEKLAAPAIAFAVVFAVAALIAAGSLTYVTIRWRGMHAEAGTTQAPSPNPGVNQKLDSTRSVEPHVQKKKKKAGRAKS